MLTQKKNGYLLVNFGGPRNLAEIRPFLVTLLTDKEVIRTNFPVFFHNLLFKKIAKKRTEKVKKDYAHIGGKSPIYGDTEAVAALLKETLKKPLVTFHRYLPATHQKSLEEIEKMEADTITVFPMFPQFTYATTGSIAKFFYRNLSSKALLKLRWIKSYPTHPSYIRVFVSCIKEYLAAHQLGEKELIFLFSAHGLPQKFIQTGDLYQAEIESTFFKVMEHFPNVLGRLAYQSKFGPGEWLRPYTDDVCTEIKTWHQGKKHILFIPISFTSDHIETLFEVEALYMPLIRKEGLVAHRLPAFNRRPDWINAIVDILQDTTPTSNAMLTR